MSFYKVGGLKRRLPVWYLRESVLLEYAWFGVYATSKGAALVSVLRSLLCLFFFVFLFFFFLFASRFSWWVSWNNISVPVGVSLIHFLVILVSAP